MRRLPFFLLILVLVSCGDDLEIPEPIYTPIVYSTEGGTDYAGLLKSQNIYYSYADSLNEAIMGTFMSNSLMVTPIYAFHDGGAGGDYYIVEASTTVHSGQVFKGDSLSNYVTYPYVGNGELLCGYYLSNLFSEYRLIDANGNEVGVFPAGHFPTPETTVGSTTYVTGFNFYIGASVKVLISAEGIFVIPKISLDFNFINKAKRNPGGAIEVTNLTQSPVPAFKMQINNLPQEDGFSDVPLIASNNFTFHQSWIWHVPSTTDGDSTTSYRLKSRHEVNFQAHTHSAKGDGVHILEDDQKEECPEFVCNLTPPDRIPMGCLVVKNTEDKQYMTNVKVFRKGETEPVYVEKSSYAPGKSFQKDLDEGKYYIEVDLGTNRSRMETHRLQLDFVEVRKNQSVTVESYYHFD